MLADVLVRATSGLLAPVRISLDHVPLISLSATVGSTVVCVPLVAASVLSVVLIEFVVVVAALTGIPTTLVVLVLSMGSAGGDMAATSLAILVVLGSI